MAGSELDQMGQEPALSEQGYWCYRQCLNLLLHNGMFLDLILKDVLLLVCMLQYSATAKSQEKVWVSPPPNILFL